MTSGLPMACEVAATAVQARAAALKQTGEAAFFDWLKGAGLLSNLSYGYLMGR